MFDLKPCPFCGSKHVVIVFGNGDDHLVECESCAACGPTEDTRQEAAEAWNRRHG